MKFHGPLVWDQIPETLGIEENTGIIKHRLKRIRYLILPMSFIKESTLITDKNSALLLKLLL